MKALRLPLGIIIAAIGVYMWGFVFWAGGIVDNGMNYADQTSEDVVLGTMAQALPGSGTYYLPSQPRDDQLAWIERQKQGPMATVHFVDHGVDSMAPSVMAKGFGHMLVSVAIMALLLRAVVAALPGYLHRLGFMAGLGVVATVFANLGKPIWFHYEWSYHSWLALYDFGAYAVAGIVLAYFIRPSVEA